jgi:hypothetical protein
MASAKPADSTLPLTAKMIFFDKSVPNQDVAIDIVQSLDITTRYDLDL